MATVVSPPKDKSGTKPSRSMTHPLRDPKSDAIKRRVKKGEPFDPEDLSRRLTAHLAEQKLKAERRRDAKAKATAADKNHLYHHVPKVAATAFERTTTPDVMRQVHKLSAPALKQHFEILSLDDPNHQVTGLQRTQALEQAVVERDTLRNRNQFQWDHTMEEAAEVDIDRNVYKLPQREFNTELKRSRHVKALSTGATVFWEEEETSTIVKAKHTKPSLVFDGRNDWAQRDEDGHGGKGLPKEKASPFLRKKDSIWILGSKKEKSSKQQNKDEVVAGSFGSSPEGIKGGKINFLARFKRHPS